MFLGVEMFTVKELVPFPSTATAFSDADEVNEAVAKYGLEVDTDTCATCPLPSTTMQLLHIFFHKYCGLQMFDRGKEEWQMCQLVCDFVKENKKDLDDDTSDFFQQGCSKVKSVVHYATALGKRFQAPDALQVYLLARTCNAHTRVFFKDCMWSTVANDLSFYVAVNIAAVGAKFILLHSHKEEMVQCVIGEVRLLTECDVKSVCSDAESDTTRSDFDSDVGEDGAVVESDNDSDSICEKLLMECDVNLQRVPLYVAFPDLCVPTSVPMECLARSALHPGRVFCSEKPPKSSLFPGHVFKGAPVPNWTECTVPIDPVSVSEKLPGCIFSGHGKPVDHVSISSKLPGRIFTAHSKPQKNWTSCTVPKENVPLSVRRPGMTFCSEAPYKQKSTAPVPKRFQPALSLARVLRKSSGVAPVVMFQCRVCRTVVESSRAKLKHHIENGHGLYMCRNAHCVAAFKTENARNIHAAVHIRKMHKCDKCSEQFNHRFALQRHMTVHATRRGHKCTKCRRSYFRPEDLKEHIATSHQSATFPCASCQYRGNSKRALKQHELLHKPPALICEFCCKQFRWHSQLASHFCEF